MEVYTRGLDCDEQGRTVVHHRRIMGDQIVGGLVAECLVADALVVVLRGQPRAHLERVDHALVEHRGVDIGAVRVEGAERSAKEPAGAEQGLAGDRAQVLLDHALALVFVVDGEVRLALFVEEHDHRDRVAAMVLLEVLHRGRDGRVRDAGFHSRGHASGSPTCRKTLA